MSEVSPAFIPRTQNSEQSESRRIVDQTPLRALEQDESKVKSFETAFQGIKSNNPLQKQIAESLVNNQIDSGEYLQARNDRGDLIDIRGANGNPVTISNSGLSPLTEEQRVVLKEVTEELGVAKKDKRQAEGEIKSIARVVIGITSNNATEKNIANALIDNQIDSGDFLQARNDRGDLVDIRGANGNPVTLSSTGLSVLTPEQRGILKAVTDDLEASKKDKLKATGEVKSIEQIAAGIVSSDPLQKQIAEALVNNQIDSGDFLQTRDQNGQLADIRQNGNPVTLSRSGLSPLAEGQRSVLRDYADLLSNSAVPTEVRDLLKTYFQSGNEAAFNRVKLLTGDSNEALLKRIEDVVGKFENVRREATVKDQFYKALLDRNSPDEALGVLTAFEQSDVGDTSLLGQLRLRALAQRRLQIVTQFAQSTNVSTLNIDQSLSLLQDLGRSAIEEDRQAAIVLAQTLYKLELAQLREQSITLVTPDSTREEVTRLIDAQPIRPAVGGIDYVKSIQEIKAKTTGLFPEIEKIGQLKRANTLRRSFSQAGVDQVLSEIADLPEETDEEFAIKSQIALLYRNFVATNRPQDFDSRFGTELAQKAAAQLKDRFISPELGDNKEAFKYIGENYVRSLLPLIESFRDDPKTKGVVEKILAISTVDGKTVSEKYRYIQSLVELEKQRPLTDVERQYIQSVEMLTIFNPYLIAALRADPGATTEFLRHHFETISGEVTQSLKDGEYVPLLIVGTGPNGMSALGEVVRNNPQLARATLVIDEGDDPGGPFAVPSGPAWRLNSANKRGGEGYVMTQAPNGNELKTVRAYGSPVARWYPGERGQGLDIRQGSINTTVDYLPNPDDISLARYPTNEELQQIISLQTALLTQNLALRTELVSVEPNPNKDEQGNKIATLKIREKDGRERTVSIKIDAAFISSGLGEPSYGFQLEGSRAQRVLEETKDSSGFPKISQTLEAFKALSDRREPNKSPGRTIVIWGGGNSGDTLVENIATLFQGENPLVRDVTKIYVVSQTDLSNRPRYAIINDIKGRNGRGNLLEVVRGRVQDVDFADQNTDPAQRKIVVLDANGQPILNDEGQPIIADSGIAATGFRPQLERIFAAYTGGKSLRTEGAESPLESITLPTNMDVPVADVFKEDPSIVLLGTASRPQFESLEKLAQLPREAREALLRNGAENAVAIGFRAPDTQAAVNIWLNSRIAQIEASRQKPKREIAVSGNIQKETGAQFGINVNPSRLLIPNDIAYDDLLLSPLLSYELGRNITASGQFSGEVDFELTPAENNSVVVRFKGGSVESISSDLLQEVARAVSTEDFQRYAVNALNKRRRNPKLELGISFTQGKISPRKTFVQPV